MDLEYIYPGMRKGLGRPSEKDLRQVVQIAAILFDNRKGEELANFNVLTFPAYTEKLPSFFVELTGITQKELFESGVDFEQGFKKLEFFCRSHPIWTFDKDWGVLKQNCSYFGIHLSLPEFIRVKPKLAEWGLDPEKYSSGTLYQAVGLSMKGRVHNALHDVRSMAAAVNILEKKDGSS